MDILYLCNRYKCDDFSCTNIMCKHTTNVEYAINGPIKGPIDLIKRFKIHFKPHLYLEEKI